MSQTRCQHEITAFFRTRSRRRLARLLTLLSLAACGDRRAGYDPELALQPDYVVPVRSLSGEVVSRGDELGSPTGIALVHEHLVVANMYSDPSVTVIDPRTGEVIATYGEYGEGPGEFRGAMQVLVDGSENVIWVLDPVASRLTALSWRGLKEEQPGLVERIIDLSDTPTMSVLRVDGGFVVENLRGAEQFALLDDRGVVVARRGPLLAERAPDIPASVAGFAFQNILALHPRGDRIAAFGVSTAEVRLFSVEGSLIRTGQSPVTLQPTLNVAVDSDGEPYFRRSLSDPRGYVGAVADEERILAVFSGRALGIFGGEASAGRDVHVFDWSGELLEVLRLDTAVGEIALSEDGTTLYATRRETDPAIVRFDLTEGRAR